jgi:hypothetical protein
MTYFSYTDHIAPSYSKEQEPGTGEQTISKFYNLHKALYDRIRNRHLDLYPHWQKSKIISNTSATSPAASDTLSLHYFRSLEQAQMVEKLMGIDSSPTQTEVYPYRHPVIELRLAPDHFAIELVLSPYALWDQQNLIGKLELERHRMTLRSLLRNMDTDYAFGFWEGTGFSDMHLTTWQLTHGKVMDEWMQTFADGQDWLRFGVWYEPEHTALDEDTIVTEAFARVSELYNLYDFMLWTSNNNFHSFYEKRQRYMRRVYA